MFLPCGRSFLTSPWGWITAIVVFSSASTLMGQPQTDVLILLDGSDSVDSCLFDFEKEALTALLCTGPSHLPYSGAIAIAVVQFAGDISIPEPDVRVEVPLAILDTSSVATICGTIDDLFQGGGLTPLEAGLLKAREVLENSTTGASNRLVIILSDQGYIQNTAEARRLARILLEMCDDAPRVIAYRFSDAVGLPNGDPLCDLTLGADIMAYLSNPVVLGAYGFDPYKPIGSHFCRELCDQEYGCGTYPGNCYYATLDPDPIAEFVDFAVANICSLNAYSVTFTQQTQQSPGNPVTIAADVTFTISADATEPDVFYQWQRNGVDIADGERISGATTPLLTVSDVRLCDGGTFQCRVWTPCVTAVSQPVTMIIDLDGAADCSNYGSGDGVADECQTTPSYVWTGTVPNPDSYGDAGTGIAADPAGNIAYCGAVSQAWPGTATDYNPFCGEDLKTQDFSYDGLVTHFHWAGGPPAYHWTALFGDVAGVGGESSTYLDDYPVGLAFDPQGYVLVAGWTTPDRSYSSHVGFVRKYTPTGDLEWSRIFGGSLDDDLTPMGITTDSNGGVIVTGNYTGNADFDPDPILTDLRTTEAGTRDTFVTKLDGDGVYQWTQVLHAPANTWANAGTAVKVNAANDVIVTGCFHGAVDFDPPSNPDPDVPQNRVSIENSDDLFIMKLSSAGIFRWVSTLGGWGNDRAYGLAVDADGALYVTGAFDGTASFDPTDQYVSDPYYDPCEEPAPAYCHTSTGGDDVLLVKFGDGTSGASYLWSRTFGGATNDVGKSVAVDAHGNVVVAGSFGQTVDFDPTNTEGCPGDPACRISFQGTTDVFASAFDTHGVYLWTYTAGGANVDEAAAVTVTPAGEVWLTGSFQNTADFDPSDWAADMQTAVGDYPGTDLFVTRLLPPLLSYADCNANGIVDYCECIRGDLNGDGLIDGTDIQPFVACVLGGDINVDDYYCSDMMRDGVLDEADVPCFVNALLGVDTCDITEPCPDRDGPRGLVDCNENGIVDANDIAFGTSQDCNKNWVPDECDIAAQTSQDVDSDGIPDECEPNCNGNLYPDDWDITQQISADIDSNGVPDECQPDCNGNGVPDYWDVDPNDPDGDQVVWDDCNGNGVPDECEVPPLGGPDCNGNGIPDGCDVDPSDPDGDTIVWADCNGNLLPDACDLGWAPPRGSTDCNNNEIPDECDIANCPENDPSCQDCNGNGFPDGCDIAAEISLDENENGIPDECEEGGRMGGEMMEGGGPFGGDPAAYAEAWAAYRDWAAEQTWGPNSEYTPAEQFQRMVAKLRELGLPLRNPWLRVPSVPQE